MYKRVDELSIKYDFQANDVISLKIRPIHLEVKDIKVGDGEPVVAEGEVGG